MTRNSNYRVREFQENRTRWCVAWITWYVPHVIWKFSNVLSKKPRQECLKVYCVSWVHGHLVYRVSQKNAQHLTSNRTKAISLIFKISFFYLIKHNLTHTSKLKLLKFVENQGRYKFSSWTLKILNVEFFQFLGSRFSKFLQNIVTIYISYLARYEEKATKV